MAGLAVVLCCGGGLAAMVGLVITANVAINEQAHTAVEDYLQAVGAARYDEAYGLLCDELRERESMREFAEQAASEPRVSQYELHQTRVENDGDVVVPADVRYDNGTQAEVEYVVSQEDNGEIRYCGTRG